MFDTPHVYEVGMFDDMYIKFFVLYLLSLLNPYGLLDCALKLNFIGGLTIILSIPKRYSDACKSANIECGNVKLVF